MRPLYFYIVFLDEFESEISFNTYTSGFFSSEEKHLQKLIDNELIDNIVTMCYQTSKL